MYILHNLNIKHNTVIFKNQSNVSHAQNKLILSQICLAAQKIYQQNQYVFCQKAGK